MINRLLDATEFNIIEGDVYFPIEGRPDAIHICGFLSRVTKFAFKELSCKVCLEEVH